MSTDTTMQHTGWEDPLPATDTTRIEPAGNAAAPGHDTWGGAATDWDASPSASESVAGGLAADLQASSVSTATADAEKAKAKRKANLLIAAIAVAVVSLVGTGVGIKMNRSKPAADDYVAEPMVKAPIAGEAAHRSPAPAPVVTQQAAPQPDLQPSADPLTAKSDLSPSPAGSITPNPAPAPAATQPAPIAAVTADASSVRDLKEKDSALEAANTELKGQLAALTERVTALESKGQSSPRDDRQSEQSPRKTNAVHDVKAKQKQLAYDSDVVRGKPGTTGVARAEPERASNWSSYHTVATYPATGKAEKAWVTNGKGLIVVSVGSELEGVKVSRLAGTTVYLADGGKINVK